MTSQQSPSEIIEINNKFYSLYKNNPDIISRAPGRAEIIGNHTDYNCGFAIGAALGNSTYAAFSPRKDNFIYAFSEQFDKSPISFSLSEINKRNGHHWTNYLKAVVFELSRFQKLKKGFNVYITSTVPSSGGVSSSAALELSAGIALANYYHVRLSKLELAALCQRAENGPLVNSPCGFLDQATSALSKKNRLLFLDFLPQKGLPISRYEYIPINLTEHNLTFLIVVDKTVKRNLGESGYPERRKQCEKSLPIFPKLLKKHVNSLREVTVSEFEKCKEELEKEDRKVRMRTEHVVYENKRVLDAVRALKNEDLKRFGGLLTQSGRSALELYELDEDTPELTFLLKSSQKMDGIIGARNMGGGFSANIFALIQNSHVEKFKEKLNFMYNRKYKNHLEFIVFQPGKGAEIYLLEQN